MNKILVVGSTNSDLITTVDQFPKAGETIRGVKFLQAMGGKGANQAVAARRLGGEVEFISSVGNDSNGQSALSWFKSQGLDVSRTRIVDHVATGTAIILVNSQGENCIVVTPGANHELLPSYIAPFESVVSSASMVLLQLEIPLETVRSVIEMAASTNVPVMLNLAPAAKLEKDLLSKVSILVLNETEIEVITGMNLAAVGEAKAMDELLSLGVKTVILTLGTEGSIVRTKSSEHRVPAHRVTAVDTTAAGDTFCGAVAAQLGRGRDIVAAVKFATAASAICVTRMGAQPSIPDEAEVEKFLSNR